MPQWNWDPVISQSMQSNHHQIANNCTFNFQMHNYKCAHRYSAKAITLIHHYKETKMIHQLRLN
jgi:hypothetical protein